MRRIVEYKAIIDYDLATFNEQANQCIKDGFEPLGPMGCYGSSEDHPFHYQTFVRYEEVSK